jgi:kanamycin nucleotidyltransferase
MLTHEERLQLANELCARFAARYSDQLLLGGIYGSTARNSDTPWSDLEMLFVVADDCPAQSSHFIFQMTAVEYQVYRKSQLETTLRTPSRQWPFHMSMLDTLEVLHGDPTQTRTWLEMGLSLPLEQFHRTLEDLLPGLMVEAFGRIHTFHERGNQYDVHLVIAEMLYEMRDALCLLNKRWVTHDYYRGLVETFTFPKIPENYQYLVPALYVVRRFDEIVPLANRLMANFWRLMEREGIKVRHYVSFDEIEL